MSLVGRLRWAVYQQGTYMSLAQSTNQGHICPQRSLPTRDIYVPSAVYQQGTYMSLAQSTYMSLVGRLRWGHICPWLVDCARNIYMYVPGW
jgi:hypothetical protein